MTAITKKQARVTALLFAFFSRDGRHWLTATKKGESKAATLNFFGDDCCGSRTVAWRNG